MGQKQAERDRRIEVASLLHDVGIIGVPDRILHKPTPLESHEVGIMSHARRLSREILRASGVSEDVLAIVRNVPVWYDRPAKGGHEHAPKLVGRGVVYP